MRHVMLRQPTGLPEDDRAMGVLFTGCLSIRFSFAWLPCPFQFHLTRQIIHPS